jgi:hypothetical protein
MSPLPPSRGGLIAAALGNAPTREWFERLQKK